MLETTTRSEARARLRSAGLLLASLLLSIPAGAQDKPTVPVAEYGRWERFTGAPELSPDGAWIAYQISRVDETREMRFRSLRDSGEEQVRAWASDPEFSADSRWLVWRIGVSEQERERLADADEPVREDVGALELGTDRERLFEDVAAFDLDTTGHYLALLGYAPEEPEGKGADLRVVNLAADTSITFGNVSEYRWSDGGSQLAFVIATGADAGNGVQLYDPERGALESLDSSASSYTGLAWREGGPDLAVYRSVAAASAEGSAHEVLAWRGLAAPEARTATLVPAETGVAAGLEVVPYRTLAWSDDGSGIALGLRPVAHDDELGGDDDDGGTGDDQAGEPGDDDEPELPGVEIWHTRDVRIFPMQKVRQDRDAQRTLLAVWHLDPDRVVTLGSDLMADAELLEGWTYALEETDEPYAWGVMFGRPYHDVWLVDVATGERRRVLEKVRYSWASAGGAYLLDFDGDDYWSTEIATGERRNLTADLDADFERVDWDTPTDQLPPWGVGGWLADDAAVLLYDRFDLWRVDPRGSGATRLTDGADRELIHRIVRTDPETFSEPLAADAPLYLSLHDERTEQRGFARIPAGASAAETLVLQDAYLRDLRRADDADVLVYRAEARDDSPDYFVGGPDLADARQVTRTNPWQEDYAWTHAELVDFESEGGRPLQAALLYPARYEPGRRYPMIVYTYELLAPQIHVYEPPSERDYYNFTAWTQEGYFVLMPDIVYTWREPGRSAVESVRAAVHTIVDRGLVDPERVGLIGHSWGGWQAAYLPTRVDIFAAAVAGAPLTDFVSFMGQIHWNSGGAEVDHWETGQARMEVPYWEDPEAHRRSSPLHGIPDLNTPMLLAHGDQDGTVEFFQSTVFYNYARRAGKQLVLLVYEGENHGFRDEANQIDYHRRILEWFGHYLKGEPAPAWITEGIPLDRLEEEKRRVAAPR